MTQAISNTLNNLEQVLSVKQEKVVDAVERKSSNIDATTTDFKSILDKTTKKTLETSEETTGVSKSKKNEIIANETAESVKSILDLKNVEEDSDSGIANWTEFRDVLSQITEEANVETSLDLTLARDISEIIAQLKEAVENATELAGKTSNDEDQDTSEKVEDVAGVLLQALESSKEEQALPTEEVPESTNDTDLKVVFEQVLTMIDKSSNSTVNMDLENVDDKKSELIIKNEVKNSDEILDSFEVSQEEVIDLVENVSNETSEQMVLKDNKSMNDLDFLFDEEKLRDLHIESVQTEADAGGGEMLMQHQTPEEHGVKAMLATEVEVFDLKVESTSQLAPATQPKSVEINPSRIFEQISKQMESLQNNSKVNIVLNPESLGKVNIQLLSTKEGLSAQFTVTTQEAKDLLMKGLDGLKEALATHGVGVDNVSIKLSDTQKSSYQQDWTEQEGSRGGNKGQGQPNREEKEKGLFEKMMAQTTEEENGNV